MAILPALLAFSKNMEITVAIIAYLKLHKVYQRSCSWCCYIYEKRRRKNKYLYKIYEYMLNLKKKTNNQRQWFIMPIKSDIKVFLGKRRRHHIDPSIVRLCNFNFIFCFQASKPLYTIIFQWLLLHLTTLSSILAFQFKNIFIYLHCIIYLYFEVNIYLL